MTATLPKTLVLVGAGKMGGAMLEGWLRMGMAGSGIALVDPNPSDDLVALAAREGLALNPAPGAFAAPEVLVLATKPQVLDTAAPQVQRFVGPGTLLISVLAGKTLGDLGARLPGAGATIRAMPNLPASVGRGITGAAPGPGVTPAQRAMADALLSAIGRVEWLDDERLIDAVTAVSGSGPAYVFHLVECMAKAGAELGLPPETAMRLARATVEGAGELLHRSDLSPDTLRRNVTSPAGTTAAALDVLMAPDGLEPLMVRAVAAARRRAEELSG